jgi:hypothetical protein
MKTPLTRLQKRAPGFTPSASGVGGRAKPAGGCLREEYPPDID